MFSLIIFSVGYVHYFAFLGPISFAMYSQEELEFDMGNIFSDVKHQIRVQCSEILVCL